VCARLLQACAPLTATTHTAERQHKSKPRPYHEDQTRSLTLMSRPLGLRLAAALLRVARGLGDGQLSLRVAPSGSWGTFTEDASSGVGEKSLGSVGGFRLRGLVCWRQHSTVGCAHMSPLSNARALLAQRTHTQRDTHMHMRTRMHARTCAHTVAPERARTNYASPTLPHRLSTGVPRRSCARPGGGSQQLPPGQARPGSSHKGKLQGPQGHGRTAQRRVHCTGPGGQGRAPGGWSRLSRCSLHRRCGGLNGRAEPNCAQAAAPCCCTGAVAGGCSRATAAKRGLQGRGGGGEGYEGVVGHTQGCCCIRAQPADCNIPRLSPGPQGFAALRAIPEQLYLEQCSSSSNAEGVIVGATRGGGALGGMGRPRGGCSLRMRSPTLDVDTAWACSCSGAASALFPVVLCGYSTGAAPQQAPHLLPGRARST
jgi:hypothetical protein